MIQPGDSSRRKFAHALADRLRWIIENWGEIRIAGACKAGDSEMGPIRNQIRAVRKRSLKRLQRAKLQSRRGLHTIQDMTRCEG